MSQKEMLRAEAINFEKKIETGRIFLAFQVLEDE